MLCIVRVSWSNTTQRWGKGGTTSMSTEAAQQHQTVKAVELTSWSEGKETHAPHEELVPDGRHDRSNTRNWALKLNSLNAKCLQGMERRTKSAGDDFTTFLLFGGNSFQRKSRLRYHAKEWQVRRYEAQPVAWGHVGKQGTCTWGWYSDVGVLFCFYNFWSLIPYVMVFASQVCLVNGLRAHALVKSGK